MNKITYTLIVTLSMCYNFLFAQLSGNYTINPIGTATSTNYKNWSSAISDLLSGQRNDGGTAQGPGVNGSVVFTVYDTVYNNTQIQLTAITGASSSRTITFQSAGGDSSKCMLKYPSGSSSSDDYVVMLNGADWINFKGIGFERTGSNAYYTVIQITNDADHNSFIRCLMKTRKLPSNTTTGWTTGIGAGIFFSGNGDTNIIHQNRFIYGYNGIYSATSCYGNYISSNVFDTNGCIGIYMTSQTGLKIERNIFSMGDFGSGQGHYVSYAIRLESSPSVIISKNKIFMLAENAQVVRGIVFVSLSGSSTAPNLVINNWIFNKGGTSSCSGISIYGANYLDICYNNFLITAPLKTSVIVHHNSTYTNTYVNIRNNNFINKGGGLIYEFPSTNGGLDTVVNNNCYITDTFFGKYNNVNYNSLSAWKTGTGKDANSLALDPGYTANTDLHVSNVGINGKAVPYWRVSDDIDGDTRSTSTPDIGADEFFPVAYDAGIISADSPLYFCPGIKNVKVKFQNFGSNTITSLKIYWQVNGNAQTTYNWSGSVSPGNSSGLIQIGSYNFAANTAYTLKIWTDSPNNQTDGNKLNDTLTTVRYAGMAGTYTIGDVTNSDFKSFNNAITAMTARGICGATTFNVYDGTYTEQITLGELRGMGASNPVVFQSMNNDSTKVTVSLPSSSATGNNNACIQLAGADYVTFKKITFMRTGSLTITHVLHILNNSHHNTFESCRMINIPITATNSNANNIWSDQSDDNYNVFKKCYVKFGNYCMLFGGTSTKHETGTVVENCVFDSAYSSAIQISYNDNVIFRNNLIRNSYSRVSGNYDLQLLDCDSSIKITGNRFYNNNTDYTVYLQNCNATSSGHGITANNFIAKPSLTGVYLDAVDYQDIVFNNMNFTNASASNTGVATSSGTSSNIVIKNNNIVLANGMVYNVSSGSQVSGCNRNNLKTTGSSFAYWNGTTYSTLSAFQSATGKDVNSQSADPQYYTSTDLHIKNTSLKGAGEPVAGVTTDIDGETRNPTTPDIGADEFTVPENDAGIAAIIQPAAIICEGSHDVRVVVRNFGKDDLKSVTINWKINSSTQTPKSWTGTLKTLETDTVLLGTYTFTGNTTPAILAFTSQPNGKTDQSTSNDSLAKNIQVKTPPVVNAGQDVNLCYGDSALIGPAAQNGFAYRWLTMNNTVIGNTAKIYVKPFSDVSYVLEVTDLSSYCVNTDTISVFIKPLPTSSFSINQAVQCLAGNQYVFTNNSTGATSYIWYFGDFNVSYATHATHSYQKDNTYTVILTAISAYGCRDSSSKTAEVKPHPVSSFTVNNSGQCLNNNLFVFNNTSTGAVSWKWRFGDGQSSLLSAPSHSYSAQGTYSVWLITESAFGCQDSISKDIDVYPLPTASFSVNQASQCLDNNFFNFSNSSTGGASYAWSFGDGHTSNNINPSNSYDKYGTYEVKLVVSSIFGCKDSTSSQVYVNPAPKAKISVDDSAQCERGNLFSFTDLSTIAADSITKWKWSFGDGSTSFLQNPVYQYPKAGTYKYKLLVESNKGCKDSVSKTLFVFPQPKASFTISNDRQCLNGNHFEFTNTSTISSGTLSYFWDLGDGTTNYYQHNSHQYSSTGVYQVKLRAVSLKACEDSVIHEVMVKPHPKVNLGEDDTLYNTDQKILDAGSGFDSYLWSTGETTQQITVDSVRFGTGVFVFWVKVVKDSCEGFDSITISIQKHVSLPETQESNSVAVFPNPAGEVLYIQYQGDDSYLVISLLDVFGREIRRDELIHLQGNLYQIDMSTFAAGTYLLRINGAGINKVFRIVKRNQSF